MVKIKDLEIELKKRNWEQYLNFAIDELKKGITLKALFKAIADEDSVNFERNLENPEKSYLPMSYIQGESEVILCGEEKIEGYMEIKGKANITPKCHPGQSPFKRGNFLGCKNEPDEEYF